VQDPGHAHKTIKRIIYVAISFAGLAAWSYYSAITVVCSCVEGAKCDCTDYAIEAAETAGIVFTGIGIGLFVLSFFRTRPGIISWL
jgi:hypothetical protein